MHKRTDPLTKTTQKKHPSAQIKDQHKQSTVWYGNFIYSENEIKQKKTQKSILAKDEIFENLNE